MVGVELRLHQLEGRFIHLDGLGSAAGDLSLREAVAGNERVEVVGADLRLHQLEGRLLQLNGLGGAAGVAIGVGEVVAADERAGVVGAESRLLQLEGCLCIVMASAVRPAAW